MTMTWMHAAEAAAALGVSRSTLYAYVSRGLLRAHADPAGRSGRVSRYRRSEVERLALARQRTRAPARVARASLDWGLPVLASSLTLVQDGRLYYRGQDVQALAREASLEAVAALLWGTDEAYLHDAPRPRCDATGLQALAALDAAGRCTAGLAWLAGLDAARSAAATRPAGRGAPDARIARCIRLLHLMGVVVSGQPAARGPLHARLARAWGLDEAGGDLLRRALVLCADHELNASSFAARCVAATGADPAAAVVAGLAALSGPRHGNCTALVERLWDAALAAPATRAGLDGLVSAWCQDQGAQAPGQPLPGFGHPLYPGGDPRAQALLAALPPHARHAALSQAVMKTTGLLPSVDFALVALRRHLGLPEGHAYLVFAMGRTVGWLAHVMEQGREPGLIRPRAAYVGPLPAAAADPATQGCTARVIKRR